MLRCWVCNGAGVTNADASGWGIRCESCWGTGNAGCLQLLFMFACAVFGCLLAPLAAIFGFASSNTVQTTLPGWSVWPLAIAGLVLWYVFYVFVGIWKQLLCVAAYMAQAPRPIKSPAPGEPGVITQIKNKEGEPQAAGAVRISIYSNLGPAQVGEEVTLRIDSVTKTWKMTAKSRSNTVFVDLPATANYGRAPRQANLNSGAGGGNDRGETGSEIRVLHYPRTGDPGAL